MAAGLLLIAGGVAAGIFGSLLGLGGGILIVPLLTLGFGLPLREAVGASLIAVIVTSGASAGVYLERHVANLRLGMTLELFTASGALVGGLVAFLLPDRVLAGLFSALLCYTGVSMARRGLLRPAATPVSPSGAEAAVLPIGAVGGSRPVETGAVADSARERDVLDRLSGPGYRVRNLPLGIAGSLFAGVVSALLGVGGGIVKVPLMNLAMNVPLRVAAATSNLMIGVTGSSSAIVYLLRGGIDPYVAAPTAVGVFLGASLGSRTAHRVDLRVLRILFVAVMAYTALEMLLRAIG